MMEKKPKRPRDLNQLATHMVDLATGAKRDASPEKSTGLTAAAQLERLGGLRGGLASAQKLSSKERTVIAKKATAKRSKDNPAKNKKP
jgi:hypothetical protein